MSVALVVLFLATAVGLEVLGRTQFAFGTVDGVRILGFLNWIGVLIWPKVGPHWKSKIKGEDNSFADE